MIMHKIFSRNLDQIICSSSPLRDDIGMSIESNDIKMT